MKVFNYHFKGTFNKSGEIKISAPNEDMAWETYFGITGEWGQFREDDVTSVESLGVLYEWEPDEVSEEMTKEEQWLGAVRLGEIPEEE